MAELGNIESRLDAMAQDLHELKSNHNQDIRDLNILVRELQDRLNQEETDRERADTSLHDEIDRVERSQ